MYNYWNIALVYIWQLLLKGFQIYCIPTFVIFNYPVILIMDVQNSFFDYITVSMSLLKIHAISVIYLIRT